MPSPSPVPENAPDEDSPPTGAASSAAVAATVTVPVGVFECVRDEVEQYAMQDGWLRPCVGPY